MNWNGMTEPLNVGDRVRIVGGGPIEDVGIITTVTQILPMGTRYGRDKRSKTEWYDLEWVSGMKNTNCLIKGRERPNLYKLPPDWDERTQNTTIKNKEPA